jgi:hypothetical protein
MPRARRKTPLKNAPRSCALCHPNVNSLGELFPCENLQCSESNYKTEKIVHLINNILANDRELNVLDIRSERHQQQVQESGRRSQLGDQAISIDSGAGSMPTAAWGLLTGSLICCVFPDAQICRVL